MFDFGTHVDTNNWSIPPNNQIIKCSGIISFRQCGKTTLLRRLFPKAHYALLEDPDVIARVRADPHAFLDDLDPPVILDEIQNAPELMRHICSRIDAHPRQRGQWLLTGSQEAPLMRGVTESMAGRAAILQLLPLATTESPKVSPLHGGFPPVIAAPHTANLWFRSYVQTYLERDVRAVTAIRDLATFRRFLTLLATRSGAMLNRTDLAAPLGVSLPTISDWLAVLEITGQILLVTPFFENFGKRLVKSPKIYFVDSGLACHLLGIVTQRQLRQSPFLGPLYEGFVAAEIVKQQVNAGRRIALHYFRDQQGLEVDFLVPQGDRRVTLLEVKATRTPTPVMAGSLQRLAKAIRGYQTSAMLIHETVARQSRSPAGTALLPGVRAADLGGALKALE